MPNWMYLGGAKLVSQAPCPIRWGKGPLEALPMYSPSKPTDTGVPVEEDPVKIDPVPSPWDGRRLANITSRVRSPTRMAHRVGIAHSKRTLQVPRMGRQHGVQGDEYCHAPDAISDWAPSGPNDPWSERESDGDESSDDWVSPISLMPYEPEDSTSSVILAEVGEFTRDSLGEARTRSHKTQPEKRALYPQVSWRSWWSTNDLAFCSFGGRVYGGVGPCFFLTGGVPVVSNKGRQFILRRTSQLLCNPVSMARQTEWLSIASSARKLIGRVVEAHNAGMITLTERATRPGDVLIDAPLPYYPEYVMPDTMKMSIRVTSEWWVETDTCTGSNTGIPTICESLMVPKRESRFRGSNEVPPISIHYRGHSGGKEGHANDASTVVILKEGKDRAPSVGARLYDLMFRKWELTVLVDWDAVDPGPLRGRRPLIAGVDPGVHLVDRGVAMDVIGTVGRGTPLMLANCERCSHPTQWEADQVAEVVSDSISGREEGADLFDAFTGDWLIPEQARRALACSDLISDPGVVAVAGVHKKGEARPAGRRMRSVGESEVRSWVTTDDCYSGALPAVVDHNGKDLFMSDSSPRDLHVPPNFCSSWLQKESGRSGRISASDAVWSPDSKVGNTCLVHAGEADVCEEARKTLAQPAIRSKRINL